MKIMMFKINLLLILIIPGLLHAQEVMDYKAEYFFETDKFSVSGIRELKTTDNQSSLTFNAKTKLLKLFFESLIYKYNFTHYFFYFNIFITLNF